ncbi:hypothetical protein MTR67_052005 [Solanum verrucosum]|uniref:Uncharacterized protein n=1 Tax=Solanum verrucosum TaxID=315347 RepID=A0AAF0V668_SOLVR|nr:hypothetical protein MTR67_052005 [Solanum verrucosum]
MARGPRLPCLATAYHDHEGLHDLWWPPRVMVPPVVGKAMCPKKIMGGLVVMPWPHGRHGKLGRLLVRGPRAPPRAVVP